MNANAATATDIQIRALQVEAQTAGDLVQVALCKIALGTLTGNEACIDALADSKWADLDPRTGRDEARTECARVIVSVE